MDKIDRLLDAMEHPERYSPDEIEALLQDQEVKGVFDLLDKTKSSLKPIFIPDIEDEWKRFEDKYRDSNKHNRLSFTSIFPRNFVASIVVGVVSFTAVAAIMTVGINHINDSRQATAEEIEVVSESMTIPVQSDTIKSAEGTKLKVAEIIVFEDEPLEVILNDIAGYYDCKVTFNNESSKILRLYFRWNRSITVEEVVERLNNFEQIKLTVKDKTINVD